MIDRLSTGVAEVDHILCGGLVARRSYLVRGAAGTGKTTLGLHFLTTGAREGEPALFVALGEPVDRLRQQAAAAGFDLSGVEFLDLAPSGELLGEGEGFEMFDPADVVREPLVRRLTETLDRVKPKRVFVDPVTQLRYVSPDLWQFRRTVVSFLRRVTDSGATVLCTSEVLDDEADQYLQVVCDGVVTLTMEAHRRALQVTKSRASDFRSGLHSFRLSDRGMRVFPRLLPEEHDVKFDPSTIASGIPELDEVLHGGIERGTVTLFTGPAGVGKTTIGIQFMKEAAGRGERSVVFSFEEQKEIILERCESLNIPAKTMIEKGTLSVVRVEPLGMSGDEFAAMVRREVEERGARIVMIDSVAGYRLTLRGGDLVQHLHALCKYLQNMGVAVLLINEVEAIAGEFRVTDVQISYLADNVVFIRYMEWHAQGRVELRKAIGVLKKRLSSFDHAVRELEFCKYGIKVGRPLGNVDSILSTMPVWRPE